MKIFVIGATGFVGRHLTKRLIKEGHEVICGGRSFEKISEILDKVKTAQIDLRDKNSISNIIKAESPDVVYHAGALVMSSSYEDLRRTNVDGTENVLSACLASGVKRVIYVSSVAVVSGNPESPLTEDVPYKATNPYGQSKLEAEKIAVDYRKKGLKIAILRPPFIYGEDDPHGLGRLIEGFKKRIIPILGAGKNRIHMVSVENLVDVLVLCLSKEEAYEGTYFVADSEALSLRDMCEFIAKALNVRPPFVIPERIMKILLIIPFINKRVRFFMKDRIYSIKRLEEKLGYVPRISVHEGIKKAVLNFDWKRYKENTL
ncbi:MAG: NAD(P)-dependent oxidoreductase [Candidatus Omnitrophota bacterium]